MKEEGFTIIDEQSFWVDLENWGKVPFITGYELENNLPNLSFHLADSEDNILYNFSEFHGNKWVFYEVRAISFKDVNKDGVKDIIVNVDYILGHGKNAAVPFPIGGVYFQKEKEFINIPELDEQINDANKNENIAMIEEFVKEKKINLEKY
jgi:hypothetical protein